MSQWYGRQFGDTAQFAVRVSFLSDPNPGRGLPADQVASWGTLEIWARGKCLTRSCNVDGTYADGVTWYLLPVLEWLGASLGALLNEEAFPSLLARDEMPHAAAWLDASEEPLVTLTANEEDDWFERRSSWRERHALRSGVLDAAFPMILLRRVGSFVEVSWDNEGWSSTNRGLSFVEGRGATLVRASDASGALVAVVREAQLALRSRCASERLDALGASAWSRPARWQDLLHPDTAAAVALIPKLAATIKAAQDGGILAQHTFETLALRAVRTRDPARVRQIVAFVQGESCAWSDDLLRLRRPTDPVPSRPWRQGYAAARSLREAMAWGEEPLEHLADWMSKTGISSTPASLDQVSLLTVGVEGRTPRVVAPPRPDAPECVADMALATGLGHLLLDQEPIAADGPLEYWPVSARARAFGAMLLMPEDGVRAELRAAGGVSAAGVRRVMARYHTTPLSTTWHLKNLGILGDEQWASLVQEFGAA